MSIDEVVPNKRAKGRPPKPEPKPGLSLLLRSVSRLDAHDRFSFDH